jgi:hypothetical protein
MRINFRNYENTLVLSADGFGHYFLRSAIAVHLRGVDQVHAKLDPQTQRGDFSSALVTVFAHAPRALAKRGNAGAIG